MATELEPRAHARATVIHGNSRFTLLGDRLIRMEWSADGRFEDRASLIVLNRRLPVPRFTRQTTGNLLTITTRALTITHRNDSLPFSPSNLTIRFREGSMAGEWTPGQTDSANLCGTLRTLDGMDGEIVARDSTRRVLEPGLLSRSGWTLIDDSDRPLFDGSPHPWVIARPPGKRQDLYFFAYGRAYKYALRDFIAIGGRIPMPPRYAFGYWYSRWRSSSELELRDLVKTFRSLDVPLDVLLIDMDWHITALPEFFDGDARRKDQAGQDYGWTGFTWNRNLFPAPEKFLNWAHREGLRVALNLHPASGVHPHEEQYPAMARAMGIDPTTGSYVPFDIVNKQFARSYFDLILHPMEKEGVDFWWLDWQQWNTTSIEGVNPTFYLNHLHFTDMERSGRRRPIIYHRWGGLGNHRYQIGFSGDTRISWASLDFQPYFTSTAANVGFGYWGNDIGGFYGPPNTPELFTRWFQFGVFSPILKTHATGRDFSILRKIWEYPHETFLHLRDLLHLRYAFVPYLYTAARTAHDTGISPCHPLYYDYPDIEEAYTFRNEYFFGPDIIVHPITKPIGPDSLFTMQNTWLPPGEWFEWHSGALLQGGKTLTRAFRIQDIPLYVRAGAIIPMAPPMAQTSAAPVDPLILTLSPGKQGECRLYEDDGNTTGYLRKSFASTRVSARRKGNRLTLQVQPAEGSYPGMPSARSLEIRIPRSLPPSRVEANGKPLTFSAVRQTGCWMYDGMQLTATVLLPPTPVRQRSVITLEFPAEDAALLDSARQRMEALDRFSRFLSDRRNFRRQDKWNDARYSSDRITRAAQTGLRINHNPHLAADELAALNREWPAILEMIAGVAEDQPEFRAQYQLLRAIP